MRTTVATRSDAIAVIGMSCRFPGAGSPDGFWDLLVEGVEAIGEAPAGRWPSEPGLVRRGGFLDDVAGFDAAFFGISPREATAMDPQQRLALELAWEALENAGIEPGGLRGTPTGVFIGAIQDDYASLARRSGAGAGVYTLTGLHRSVIANRVSYHLGLRGPSLVVDTGQSSALVAVHRAIEALRSGECTTVLAGGVNLILSEESTAAVRGFGGLSPTGRTHLFDARADGYVRGEGGGLVVLKPLAAALADGDDVACVIHGGAVNNDGGGTGLTTPSREGQEQVIRLAHERAGTDPGAVGYVELHGTGTPVGDPIEAAALGAVIGATRAGDQWLAVGSVKTNVGHLEGAAGAAGLIKTVLALRHGVIPATLNHEIPNPAIDFAATRIAVQTTAGAWPDGRPLAGVSSFGMGGTNCHLVLGPAPDRAEPAAGPAALAGFAWPVSGNTPEALRAQAERIHTYLAARPGVTPAEAGRALAARTGFGHRAVVTGGDRDELLAGLAALAGGRRRTGVIRGRVTGGATAFLLTGQGA